MMSPFFRGDFFVANVGYDHIVSSCASWSGLHSKHEEHCRQNSSDENPEQLEPVEERNA